MSDLPELPADAFAKDDPTPDPLFYASPRFVAHIDAKAIGAVTDLYRTMLPAGGVILDLMSSWISHLPEEVAYGAVIGHGMNAEELRANPRLARSFVQDLNAQPKLPLEDASIDAATMCVSVQCLERPVDVMRDLRRVLRPEGRAIVTFSNRCFPTKAVAVWKALGGADHCRLVQLYLQRAGFTETETRTLVPPGGASDPLHAVIGQAPR